MSNVIVAIIRANLIDDPAFEKTFLPNDPGVRFKHIETLTSVLKKVATVQAVILALPDDPRHRELDVSSIQATVFYGDAKNMNRRMLKALGEMEATAILDCSVRTECIDPAIYDRLIEHHLSGSQPLTIPHLWYSEYLPKIVDVAEFKSIAENRPWPYYEAIEESRRNLFTPDLDAYAKALSHLDPLCQKIINEKARKIRLSYRDRMSSIGPDRWITRSKALISQIEELFSRRSVSILEVGYGRSFGVGLMLYLFGAENYTGIDVNKVNISSDRIRLFDEYIHLKYKPTKGLSLETIDLNGMRLMPIKEDYNNESICSFFDGAVQYKKIEAGILEFPDDSFDFIFSDSVMEHVFNCKEAIAELYRVTKKGGYAFHNIGFDDHTTAAGDAHLCVSKEEWFERWPDMINLLRPYELYDMFIEAGFEIVSIREVKGLGSRFEQMNPEHLIYGRSDAQTVASHVTLRKA
ncbi:methyltransferase domain-containing protein [Pseudodesulfovibrio sp.]|nr:methyltransferase domain-containing protein [Pseudodesulfovibrio sp.]